MGESALAGNSVNRDNGTSAPLLMFERIGYAVSAKER